MLLATLADLADIGAVAANEIATSDRGTRAMGLLAKASAQAMVYLGVTDTDVAAMTTDQRGALAAIVAEAAGSRLQYAANPTTDSYGTTTGYVSSLLNRQHYRALDALIGKRGSSSLVVVRDEDSSYFRPYVPFDGWA